ncbi:MAG: hypothetical protein AAGI67_10055 [Pseudomonadota bacterium]
MKSLICFACLLLPLVGSTQPLFFDSFESRVVIPTTVQAGTVETPTGFLVTALRVENGIDRSAPPAPDGSFSIRTGLDPQLAAVVDEQDTLILLGWFAPGYTVLNTRTTAQALLYLRLGAPLTAPRLYRPLIDLIAAETAVLDVLEQVITDALAVNPQALVDEDSPIAAALDDAATTIIDNALMAPPAKAVLVSPGSQSGLDVLLTFQSVTAQNNRRRPVVTFIDRLACVTESGSSNAGSAGCESFTREQALAPVGGVQTIPQAIQDAGRILVGLDDSLPAAYVPTVTDRTLLPTPEGNIRTDYQITAIGPGQSPGIFDELSAARQGRVRDINREFVVGQLVLPVFLNIVLPAAGQQLKEFFGTPKAAGIIREIARLLLANPAFESAITDGDFKRATDEGLKALLQSGPVREAAIRLVFEGIAVRTGPGRVKEFAGRAEGFIKALKLVDGLLTTLDVTVAGKAFRDSNAADRWEVQVTPVPVTLTGAPVTASCSSAARFTVALDESPGDVQVRYRFSVDPDLGQLRDATDPLIFDFQEIVTTNSIVEFVPFSTTVQDEVELRVEAEAFDGDSTFLGRAAATISIDSLRPRIDPRIISVLPNDSVDLTATLVDGLNDRNCGGTLEPRYAWAGSDSAGALDVSPGLILDRATVTYTAGSSEGGDTITVDAYLGSQYIGSATAEVRVETQPSVILGSLVIDVEPAVDNPPNPRFCYNATVMVPDTGGTRYRMTAYGGNDPFFFGDQINDTGPPFDSGFGIVYTQADRRFFLAGACGPTNPDAEAGFQFRFGAFTWEIHVDYPE